MNLQNRFRSKTAWLSVITLGLFVAKTYFNIEIPEADKLVDLLLLTASTLGIFNNPTDKDNY